LLIFRVGVWTGRVFIDVRLGMDNLLD
jgi:hypothetical protein